MSTENDGSEKPKTTKRTIWYGVAWVGVTALLGSLAGSIRRATETPPEYWILAALAALVICELFFQLWKRIATRIFVPFTGVLLVVTPFIIYVTDLLSPKFKDIRDSAHIFADVERGEEEDGYGLYTYVLFREFDGESRLLVSEITRQFDSAVEAIKSEKRINLNAIVIPAKLKQRTGSIESCPGFFIGNERDTLFVGRLYDQKVARNILRSICRSDLGVTMCQNKHASGPFFVTFAKKFTSLNDSEPALFWDLTGRSPRDYGEFVYSYGKQVLSKDIGDRKELENLRMQTIKSLSSVFDTLENAVAAVLTVQKAYADKTLGDLDPSATPEAKAERPECI
ncbi:hypothetical protein ACQKGL_13280 [Ensifer adhaerens]|uniref:hypothetical protein n=1 Tax=Ensifer adhaerens TaxID=106592 RepID=UPI003CFF9558